MTDSQPARGCDAPAKTNNEATFIALQTIAHGWRCWDRTESSSVEQRIIDGAAWGILYAIQAGKVPGLGKAVAGGGGEVVTAELVGEERMRNDAMAHAMVEARVTKDDAIRMLLVERDRLLKRSVDVEKTRPRMYVIGSGEVTDEMVRAASESCAKDDEGEFPPLCDLINYSGENKTRTVVRAALVAALQVKP